MPINLIFTESNRKRYMLYNQNMLNTINDTLKLNIYKYICIMNLYHLHRSLIDRDMYYLFMNYLFYMFHLYCIKCIY